MDPQQRPRCSASSTAALKNIADRFAVLGGTAIPGAEAGAGDEEAMAQAGHDHGRDGAPARREHRRFVFPGGAQITVGILTCSDRGSKGDGRTSTGPPLHNLVVERLGASVAQYKVVPDDRRAIEATLAEWADETRLDLVFTTGGTGFSARDVTPEATRAVVEREAPALTRAMLFESLRVTPYAMLTRATAGHPQAHLDRQPPRQSQGGDRELRRHRGGAAPRGGHPARGGYPRRAPEGGHRGARGHSGPSGGAEPAPASASTATARGPGGWHRPQRRGAPC